MSRYCPLCQRTMEALVCPDDGVPTVDAALVSGQEQALAEGTVVAGRYRVDGLLGQGGMGRVYAATQLSVQRPVALKTLEARRALAPRDLTRFYREAQAATKLVSWAWRAGTPCTA